MRRYLSVLVLCGVLGLTMLAQEGPPDQEYRVTIEFIGDGTVTVDPEPVHPEQSEFTETTTLWYADIDASGVDVLLEATPAEGFQYWVLRNPDGEIIDQVEDEFYTTTEPVVTLELRPDDAWPDPSDWTAEAVFHFDLPGEFQVRRETGDVLTPGAFYGSGTHLGGADLAEWVAVSEPVDPGHVLEIDPKGIVQYRLAQGPCSRSVAGVVSTQPGMVLGSTPHQDVPSSRFEVLGEGQALLALLGVVPVKVTDEGGPIAVGDLLVVSSAPGYAMRWDADPGTPCALVGKALEPHEEGEGMIEVLLTR